MRKKMLLLALGLAATAASLTAPQAKALGGPSHLCSVCYLLANGSECCIYCRCNADGSMICPENACVPAI
jgi:hypothetical protein